MGLTTICTIQQGEPSATGTDSSYYQLWHSPGEPHRRRLDLVPDAPLAKSRLSLLQFVQITDLHIQDHESPGRMEIVSNNNDTLSIFSAMIDHAAQPNPHDNDGLWRLAALHRELAASSSPCQHSIGTRRPSQRPQRGAGAASAISYWEGILA